MDKKHGTPECLGIDDHKICKRGRSFSTKKVEYKIFQTI